MNSPQSFSGKEYSLGSSYILEVGTVKPLPLKVEGN